MNPFTKFLRAINPRAQVADVEAFVERWDVVEATVISVYKDKVLTPAIRATYIEARTWLLSEEPRWRAWFAPHWPDTLEGGQRTPSDPFKRILLGAPTADDFAGDWGAMQALAAARETLNRYILSLKD